MKFIKIFYIYVNVRPLNYIYKKISFTSNSIIPFLCLKSIFITFFILDFFKMLISELNFKKFNKILF